MIRLLRFLALSIALATLAACAMNTHPINPPNASIQRLVVLPDGSWNLQIRLENFSDITVRYSTFNASLRVGGEAAGDISLNPQLDVPGENADIVTTTLKPSADARKAFESDIKLPGGVPYSLKGTIGVTAADKQFKFEHTSRLLPVPGLPNQYR